MYWPRSAADPRAYPRAATNRHFRAEAGSPHDVSAAGRRRVWLGLAAHSAMTSRKALLTSSGCGPSDAVWSAVDLDEPDVLDEAGKASAGGLDGQDGPRLAGPTARI
jgi:hypothetical protein